MTPLFIARKRYSRGKKVLRISRIAVQYPKGARIPYGNGALFGRYVLRALGAAGLEHRRCRGHLRAALGGRCRRVGTGSCGLGVSRGGRFRRSAGGGPGSQLRQATTASASETITIRRYQ